MCVDVVDVMISVQNTYPFSECVNKLKDAVEEVKDNA